MRGEKWAGGAHLIRQAALNCRLSKDTHETSVRRALDPFNGANQLENSTPPNKMPFVLGSHVDFLQDRAKCRARQSVDEFLHRARIRPQQPARKQRGESTHRPFRPTNLRRQRQSKHPTPWRAHVGSPFVVIGRVVDKGVLSVSSIRSHRKGVSYPPRRCRALCDR